MKKATYQEAKQFLTLTSEEAAILDALDKHPQDCDCEWHRTWYWSWAGQRSPKKPTFYGTPKELPA